MELTTRQIPFECEATIGVHYKGRVIGKRKLDLLVGKRLVVELKAVEKIAPVHKAQVRTYLKITRCRLGLLINFNEVLLRDGISRIINPR